MNKKEYISFIEDGKRYMTCKNCHSYVIVNHDVTAVTCHRCTIIKCLETYPMEEIIPSLKKKSNRPMGWHFMKEFVDKDGNVFHKGKEQPKLRGTLKPTKVKNRTKKSKTKKSKTKISQDALLFKRANEYKQKQKLKREKNGNSSKNE
ncbi:MAG: hypothetical protein H8D94_00825 [Candidatus Pelagibacter sp.]|nr:hypothetical protein [Candidatus Pelagibacter sp.]